MTDTQNVFVTTEERGGVVELKLNIDDKDFKALVAVKRDDLRTFIVLADTPDGGGLKVRMILPDLINHLRETSIADWTSSTIMWGTTSWLTHREDMGWRTIRRFNITEEGSVQDTHWFPPNVAEPLLRSLEKSVPEPAHLSDDYIARKATGN